MAVRVATCKERVQDSLFAVLAPDERVLATVLTVAGPVPRLLRPLGAVGDALLDDYFLTVTETSVVLQQADRIFGYPDELVFVRPRHEVGVAAISPGASWLGFHLLYGPDEPALRLKVHRRWHREFQAFLRVFDDVSYRVRTPARGARGLDGRHVRSVR